MTIFLMSCDNYSPISSKNNIFSHSQRAEESYFYEEDHILGQLILNEEAILKYIESDFFIKYSFREISNELNEQLSEEDQLILVADSKLEKISDYVSDLVIDNDPKLFSFLESSQNKKHNLLAKLILEKVTQKLINSN